mgnify:CR=1
MRYTLGKEEKLKSKKLIEQLFVKGKRVNVYPFQMVFQKAEHQADFPIKVGFSVPKRTTRLAVNRNKIKRLMREVYRKNKNNLFGNIENQYIMMLIYTSKDKINYNEMELYMKELGNKFLSKI